MLYAALSGGFAATLSGASVPDTCYLFSYFTGQNDGLRLAWSADGYTFHQLNGGQSYLVPEVGEDNLMRDPSLVLGPDNVFRLVWTTSWSGKTIGYASSADLVNWSEQEAIPVWLGHVDEADVTFTWAPEITYDAANERYLIVWASNINGKFGDAEADTYNPRQYATTTTDFITFESPRLFFDPGYDVIDATFFEDDGQFHMCFKDETQYLENHKYLQIASSQAVDGALDATYGDITPPDAGFTPSGRWCEGGTVARVGDAWVVYYDAYQDGSYGASRSTDLVNWEDITDQISMPSDASHGTIIEVPGSVIENLLPASEDLSAPVFIFPFFEGNGEDGVYLAWGADGRDFHLLNDGNPVFTPPAWAGQNLTRDPSIVYRDGVYHMVWTSNWSGRTFGYASSTDLKHWSAPQQVQPYPAELDDIDQPDNIWAPEIFYDPIAANFRIVWASTIPREYNDGDGSTVGSYDNRQWSTTTTDFSTFTPAELFYDADVDVIDGMNAYDEVNEQWVMMVATDAFIRSVTHDGTFTGASGWSAESDPIVGAGTAINEGKRGEGPSLVKNGDEWLLYWDSTWDNDWGMAASTDLVNWTDLTTQFRLYRKDGTEYVHPRHGTIFKAPRSALAAFAEVPQAYVTPRAHLMFNETSGDVAADASGNGWHGTCVNGPQRVAGQGGNGIELDGIDDYVSLPTGVVAPLGDFSIATWVYLDSVANWARIFDFGTGTTSNMFLTPKNGANGFVRFAITTSGGSGEDRIDGTAALPAGAWTHVAITKQGSVGILYVNGVEAGRNEAMSLTPKSLGFSTQNWIGRSQYSDPYLDGRVDDFRIYSGALSASEVLALADGTARALLSPWTSGDVGGPALAGSAGNADADASTIYLTASGSDIWSASDQFHYAWQSWTGDGTFIARVDALANTDAWAKAGIMFRESLAADARNCLVAITPGNGCTFQTRSSTGGATTSEVTSGVTVPAWIKLVREGDTFTPYYSADGAIWTQAASAATLSIPSTAYVGLALTSHSNANSTAAVFKDVSVIDAVLRTSLDHWRYDAWGTIENAGDAADRADPDGDGRSNLFEYGVGSDPFSADAGGFGAVTVAADQATYEITFNRIADPDLIYTVQGTDDLTVETWPTLWTSTGASNVDGPVTVEHTLGIDDFPKYFLRLSLGY